MTAQRKAFSEYLDVKQKLEKAIDTSPMFEDRMGIWCVECKACNCFIPNAVEGDVICPQCNHKFKAKILR